MNIFITGGTSGIGLSLANYYRQKGFTVGVCSRWAEEDESNFVYSVDVNNRETVGFVLSKFSEKVGGIDIIIANAGIGDAIKSREPNWEMTRKMVATNLLGVINTFEFGYKYLNQSGRMVATASVAGMVGLPGIPGYSASKAGVIKLCESLSIDLQSKGISVTAICPGFIDTPLTQKNSHKMPFLISSEKAAKLIAGAIEKRKALFIFPWQMKFLMLFAEKVPRWFYRGLIKVMLPILMPRRDK